MPTYTYACKDCGERLEVVRSFADDPLSVCPSCEGRLRQVFKPAGIVFKGSGWHIKDYAGSGTKAGGGAPEAGANGDGGASGKGDTGSASDSSTSSGSSPSAGSSSEGSSSSTSSSSAGRSTGDR